MTDTRADGRMSRLTLHASALLLLLAPACGNPAPVPVEGETAQVNGTTLYFEASGAGEPVILLHGGQMDRRMWDEQFEAFARQYRVIRYDLRGYGRSGVGSDPFQAHEDLYALLHHLGIQKAQLVGLSLGGRVAIDFALEHPEMVERLVLAAPGLSGWRWSAADHAFFGKIDEAARAGDLQRVTDLWLESPYMAPAMENGDLAERLRRLALDNSRAWVEPYHERELDPPALGRLTEIAAPTLLIVGSRDVPDIQQIVNTLEARIPGARRITLEGAGHMVNMERPEAFNRAVLEFLAGRAPTQPAGT